MRKHQAAELTLGRAVHVQSVQEPLVGFAANTELESAQRVCDVLQTVHDAVGKVVRRVDAPLVTDVRMRHVKDAIGNQITHSGVVGLHVALHAHTHLPLAVLAITHSLEELQVLVGRTRTMLTLCTFLTQLAHQLTRTRAHVAVPVSNQLTGELVKFVEVVRRVGDLVRLETHPFDILDDVIDILLLFGGRVGIIETKIAQTIHASRVAKVEVHRLGVADVKIAIGLGRETSDHPTTGSLQMRLQQFGSLLSVCLGGRVHHRTRQSIHLVGFLLHLQRLGRCGLDRCRCFLILLLLLLRVEIFLGFGSQDLFHLCLQCSLDQECVGKLQHRISTRLSQQTTDSTVSLSLEYFIVLLKKDCNTSDHIFFTHNDTKTNGFIQLTKGSFDTLLLQIGQSQLNAGFGGDLVLYDETNEMIGELDHVRIQIGCDHQHHCTVSRLGACVDLVSSCELDDLLTLLSLKKRLALFRRGHLKDVDQNVLITVCHLVSNLFLRVLSHSSRGRTV
mmetsp:Transcript_1116/g.2676  ORF Transcript_1116/g.2676 Transcript_1116/m.2676 type:complete len:504 (+) Transcript_1116:908-2419(+)